MAAIQSTTTSPCGNVFVIRNKKSGLVLDASHYKVKLQPFQGLPAQLWRFEMDGTQRLLIVSMCTGKVLEVEGGARNGGNVVTYERNGGAHQRWHLNCDGTIVSAEGAHLALDVREQLRSADNEVVVWHVDWNANQLFDYHHP